MQALIALIGIFIMLEGVLFIARPDMLKKTLSFFIEGQRLYAGGVIRLILAVLFLIIANRCAHSWLIIIFGIIFLLGAIFIFSMELHRLKKMLRWWLGQKVYMIRLVGIAAMLIGLLIVYGAIIQWP